jgi:probable addiction module antidote protein
VQLTVSKRKYYMQLALRNVVEAQGGISEVSSKMNVGRESFYKSLSQKGKPRFSTIMHALKSCYGVDYTVSGMTHWLKRHFFSYKKPALVPGKANLEKITGY